MDYINSNSYKPLVLIVDDSQSILKYVMELWGHIDVDSTVGEGTAVTIKLLQEKEDHSGA